MLPHFPNVSNISSIFSICLVYFTQKLTHRYVVKGDISDVVVGAALPWVVEPEAKGAGVASIQGCVFPKCTVLHVDGPVIDLHAPDRKITADKHTHTQTHYHWLMCKWVNTKLLSKNLDKVEEYRPLWRTDCHQWNILLYLREWWNYVWSQLLK